MVNVDDLPVPMISKRRMSFVFVEKQKIEKSKSALLFICEQGKVEIPCSQIAAVFMGRGTSITHDAIMLCAEMGVNVLWTGDGTVRFYASGVSIANKPSFAIKQAELVSKRKERLRVAREMYQIRFPDEVLSKDLTLQQLRGREGTRVKNGYIEIAKRYDIEWNSRVTRMHQMSDNDTLNKAVTMATSCLYGLCHSVICGIGAIPSLGFVHSGNSLSFVFDIADLYKVDFAVDTAFRVVSQSENIPILDLAIRREMREVFYKTKLASVVVDDIKKLFSLDDNEEELRIDSIFLWDDKNDYVISGNNWG